MRPALLARERTNPKRIKDHGCHLGHEKSGRARVVRIYCFLRIGWFRLGRAFGESQSSSVAGLTMACNRKMQS